MPPAVLNRLRKLALSLPEAHEVEAWGAPTFRVNNKLFAMFSDASSNSSGNRHAVWIKNRPTNQEYLIDSWPTRFFKPPYVGPSGWVGVYLDRATDWDGVRDLLNDAWNATAPSRLKKALTEPETAPRVARKRARR